MTAYGEDGRAPRSRKEGRALSARGWRPGQEVWGARRDECHAPDKAAGAFTREKCQDDSSVSFRDTNPPAHAVVSVTRG